jgi:sulfide:quinone oxidoreductase
MALRFMAGSRVGITLVTPDDHFTYRAMSVAEPFGLGSARRHPLKKIARDFGVELVTDALDRAAPNVDRIFTRAGTEIGYDALVLAVGARGRPVWDNAITFAGSRDVEAVRGVVEDIESGAARSAAFVIPSGSTWPLPLYELALMTAQRAGDDREVALYTPEEAPLAVFGREASLDVAAELERAGVHVVASVAATVTPAGEVAAAPHDVPRRFDRIIALPRLEGPSPRGVPHDVHGFIPIDTHGIVRGLKHVYAAGDGTDYPVKQGGMAASQADAVAEVIAKRAGAGVDPRPFRTLLRGELFTGGDPRFLQGERGSRARPRSDASDAPLWWPVAKIAGLHLAPYLAGQDADADGGSADTTERASSAIVYFPSGFENNPWGE